MHILFTRFPYTSAHGGAEKQTQLLMEGLVARGHTVEFLGSCEVLLERSKKSGVRSQRLAIGKPPVTKWLAISFLWRQFGMKKKLINHYQSSIINHQFDAVCMLSLTEKLLLTPYLTAKGVKVVWIEHDTVGRWLTMNPWLVKLRRLSNDVKTVCVSELSAEIFRKLGYENVVAIPNGVPPPPRPTGTPPPNRGRGRGRGLVIGCIARRSPEKGVDVLEEAVEDMDDVELNVYETGKVIDIEKTYAEMDVLVLPSRKEDPFGLVVAEAMMRGIPVICTDACGIAGYLTNEVDALVVRAGDGGELREAIEKVKSVECRVKYGIAGRKTALEKFTVERMVEEYEKIMGL